MAYERNETIEELEEKIRIKKDKLERSEAHSNKRSTKTKPLKESQLKASIHESEKRLQAALAERGEQSPEPEDVIADEEPVEIEEGNEVDVEEQEVQETEEVEIINDDLVEEENQEADEADQQTPEQDDQSYAESEIEACERARNSGRGYTFEDKGKMVRGMKAALQERYDSLAKKEIFRGQVRVESVDDARKKLQEEGKPVYGGKDKEERIRSELFMLDQDKKLLESGGSSDKSRFKGSENRLERDVDEKIRDISARINLKFDNSKKNKERMERDGHDIPDHIDDNLGMMLIDAIDAYCMLEEEFQVYEAIQQRKKDIEVHETYVGDFSATTTEKVQQKKKGLSGLLGRTEEVNQTRNATREEMFERKGQARETIQGKLDNGEINQECFGMVSESLDRLYGNEPQKVSSIDLQEAKEEAGIRDPEPVIYETVQEVANEQSVEQEIDDQPVLRPHDWDKTN